VTILFSVSALTLLVVAGGTIDYATVVKQQVALQNAADSAVLSSVSYSGDDSNRSEQAEKYFAQNVVGDLANQARITSFEYSAQRQEAQIAASAEIPVTFLKLAGWTTWPITVTAKARSGTPANRVLELSMCIDVTGSMQNTIDSATARASSLETDINNALRQRNLQPFDAIRAVVHSYRDYGGNNPDYRSNHYTVAAGGYVDKMPSPGAVWMPAGDSRHYGDAAPLTTSAHFTLPNEATAFRDHLSGLQANGGGDLPESGLECVNAALNANWLKKGDPMPGGAGGTIGDVYPLIVIWTDVDAQPPSHYWSLLNGSYPSQQDMPRDYAGLLAKWQDADRIDQDNKLLVTFMPSNNTPVWNNIRNWPRYFSGGTLQTGNTSAVTHIVNALATLPTVSSTLALTE
jgi:Flp pilus assembly protein TadG